MFTTFAGKGKSFDEMINDQVLLERNWGKDRKYLEARRLFFEAESEMHGRQCPCKKINKAREQLRKAKKEDTLDAFKAAARLFFNTSNAYATITAGKNKIKKAMKICDDVDKMRAAALGGAAGGAAASMPSIDIDSMLASAPAAPVFKTEPAPAASASAPAPPTAAPVFKTEPDYDEPAPAASASACAPPRAAAVVKTEPTTGISPALATARVFVSAPAARMYQSAVDAVGAFNRVWLSAAEPPASAGAGQKRLADDARLVPDAPKKSKPLGGMAVGDDEAGSKGKEHYEYAYNNDTQLWHPDVHELFMRCKEKGVYNYHMMGDEAFRELRTLNVPCAMLCLMEVLEQAQPIKNVNWVIVKRAMHLRSTNSLRAVDEILIEQGVMSDPEDEDKDCDDEDEDSEAEDVVYAGKGFEWHDDVDHCMGQLADLNMCSFSALNAEARDELRTLPVKQALRVLDLIYDEFRGDDVSAFIVQWARKIRKDCYYDDAAIILEQWKAADDDKVVVYAWEYGQDWHDDVFKAMRGLAYMQRYTFDEMSVPAMEELRTLPLDVAITVLTELRDEFAKTGVRSDANAFVVKGAQRFRKEKHIDDAGTIYKRMEAAFEKMHSTESEADEPAAVDSQGNSIEY